METINGKVYPMWSQFTEKKTSWIGGKLQGLDNVMGPSPETEIIDVTLSPNGEDSAMLMFHGKDYDCGYDVRFCGIGASDSPEWLEIHSSWGDSFRVQKKKFDS